MNTVLQILLPVGMAASAIVCSAQSTLVVTPSRDAGIGYHDNYNSANTNYNNAAHFAAFSQPGNNGGINSGRGLIDFDLSPIPAGSTVFGAFLSVTGKGPFSPTGVVTTVGHMGQNTCWLERVTSPWSDNTVTWNTQPTSTPVNHAVFPPSTYSTENYVAVDVTALIQDIVDNPGTSHGMKLKLANEVPSNGLAFHSSLVAEADKRPTLVVVYGNCETINGVEEINENTAALQLTPNLVSAGMTVRVDLPEGIENGSTLEMTDHLGRIVDLRSMSQTPFQYTVPATAVGTYFVTVRNNASVPTATGRLVIQ